MGTNGQFITGSPRRFDDKKDLSSSVNDGFLPDEAQSIQRGAPVEPAKPHKSDNVESNRHVEWTRRRRLSTTGVLIGTFCAIWLLSAISLFICCRKSVTTNEAVD